jgi:hypothetical protein
MLQIDFEYDEKHKDPEVTASKLITGTVIWKAKEPFPEMNAETRIVRITADKLELDMVLAAFKYLPYCIGHTQWDGYWAEFIYRNFLHSLNN